MTTREVLTSAIVGFVSLLAIFNGLFQGLIISNCVHLFHHEPWAHHLDWLVEGEYDNWIMSDVMDGADANLSPTNVRTFILSEYLQLFRLVSLFFSTTFGRHVGGSLDCLFIFYSMFFFFYLYLRKIQVSHYVALATCIGFTYGATNLHLHWGWAVETSCAVIVLYCIERVLSNRKWIDVIWLTLAFVNLGGRNMVHVVLYLCIFLLCYLIVRVCSQASPAKALTMIGVAGVASILLSLDRLLPVAYHYAVEFEKGYREGVGILQNSPDSFFTFLMGNLYGHPRTEKERWVTTTYIGGSMFIGSFIFLVAFSAGFLRAMRRRDPLPIFFTIATLFSIAYIYRLPFEKLELAVGALPWLRWVYPFYWKAVFHIIVAVLGALGADYLFSLSRKDVGTLALCWIMVATLAIGGYLVYFHYYRLSGPSAYLVGYFWKSTALMLLGWVFFLASWRRNHPALLWGLIAVVLGESVLNSANWIPYARAETCWPRTAVTDFLKEHTGEHRIIGLEGAAIPALINKISYGVETAAGRSPVSEGYRILLQQADPTAYVNHGTAHYFIRGTKLDAPIWDLADVKFFVAPKSFDWRAAIEKYGEKIMIHELSDGVIIERTPTPQHFRIYTQTLQLPNEHAMKTAVEDGLDTREVLIVESELPSLESGRALATLQVKQLVKTTNRITAEIETSENAFVVASELFTPNFQLFVNGVKIETFRAFFFLIGFRLPAGTHQIELVYVTPYQRILFVTTSIMVVSLAVLSIAVVRKDRRTEY